VSACRLPYPLVFHALARLPHALGLGRPLLLVQACANTCGCGALSGGKLIAEILHRCCGLVCRALITPSFLFPLSSFLFPLSSFLFPLSSFPAPPLVLCAMYRRRSKNRAKLGTACLTGDVAEEEGGGKACSFAREKTGGGGGDMCEHNHPMIFGTCIHCWYIPRQGAGGGGHGTAPVCAGCRYC